MDYCEAWGHRHEWRLARIEPRYKDGIWDEPKKQDDKYLYAPVSIGTMGLFYCRNCLTWTTSFIPADLPGFGA